MTRAALSASSRFTALGLLVAAGCTEPPDPRACAPDNASLSLPAGFCAQVVADGVGPARHIAVAPNGDIYLALRDSGGSLLALREANADGIADQRTRFGPRIGEGLPFYRRGGTGIAFFEGYLYFASDTSVIRWRWRSDLMVPAGEPETILTELAVQEEHQSKAIAFARDGSMFVNFGAPSNACQKVNRLPGSMGVDPCSLLEAAGGIWRFDARRPMQRFADGTRRATGLRNVIALAIGPDSVTLWGVQHGRDLLHENRGDQVPALDQRKGADNPAEELIRIDQNTDFGWPYCYFDRDLNRKVLSPEYGGDGHAQGRCVDKDQPLMTFPGHWAPESMVFYLGDQFPFEFRAGAFVAFHGSWMRGGLPQAGFIVAYVPFVNGRPAGTYRVFADGFRGETPRDLHRPMGLAVAPDGSLLVSDDHGGRIYRIWYTGR